MSEALTDIDLRDRRRTPRYPVHAICELRAGQVVARGECLDLSETGAAILTDSWDAPHFQLRMTFEAGCLDVRCETVRVEPVRGRVVVHARFLALGKAGRGLIGGVLERARDEFEAAQLALVTGRPRTNGMVPEERRKAC